MPKNFPKLSVVIPAYNEAERLKKTLPEILDYFAKQRYKSEIIIANDGSSDSTAQLIKRKSKKHSDLILVDLAENQGKGGALRAGIAESKGSWVLFMDADLSTPLEELDKFWKFTKEHQVIIGSRKTKGSKVTKRQNLIRENLGKVFTWLTNVLATKNITDVTCGFKLFEGKVGRKLFATGVVDDWSFDAEILFLAQKFDHSIKEVPVAWQNDPRTKVNMIKDGLKALNGLVKIRWNDLSGQYKT